MNLIERHEIIQKSRAINSQSESHELAQAVQIEQEVDQIIDEIRQGLHDNDYVKKELMGDITSEIGMVEEEKDEESVDMHKPDPSQNQFVYIQSPRIKQDLDFQSTLLSKRGALQVETSIVIEKDKGQWQSQNDMQ